MINWHLSSLVLALAVAFALGSVFGQIQQASRTDTASVSEVQR